MHLLLRTDPNGEGLSQIFRRVGAQYVYWYNAKYGRVGHLFQDRYRSEAVGDDAYLITVLRYIHQNPVKAGITREIGLYRFSSYAEYLNPTAEQLTDVEFIGGMMGTEEFIALHETSDETECMDIGSIRARMSDEQTKTLMRDMVGCNTVEEFQNLDKARRIEIIGKLKKKNASYRQISRLTGESIGVIRNI